MPYARLRPVRAGRLEITEMVMGAVRRVLVTSNGARYTTVPAIAATRDCPPNSPYNPSTDNWWTNNGTCSGGATATSTARPTATTARATATTARATATNVRATATTTMTGRA